MRQVPEQKCSVEGCQNAALKRKDRLCMKHRKRLERLGSVEDLALKVGPAGWALRWLEDHKGWSGAGCLIWPFYRNQETGYARHGEHYAHVTMCEIVNGQPPSPDHESAHSCGNGHLGCVHPKHLRWATTAENHADKHLHGTMPIGERNGNSRLTEEQVRLIRISNRTLRDLAQEMGVSMSTIGRARRVECWKEVQ